MKPAKKTGGGSGKGLTPAEKKRRNEEAVRRWLKGQDPKGKPKAKPKPKPKPKPRPKPKLKGKPRKKSPITTDASGKKRFDTSVPWDWKTRKEWYKERMKPTPLRPKPKRKPKPKKRGK